MPRDWAASDYTRIYHTIVDDPKFEEVYDDDARLSWYVRLLMAADATYPAAAPLPFGMPAEVLEHLTKRGIVVRVRGGHYRIKAHEAERESRGQGRGGGKAAGGKARVAGAERDELGRLLPSQHSSSTENVLVPAPPAARAQHSPAKPASRQQTSQHRNAGEPSEPAKTRRDETRRDEDEKVSTPRTRAEPSAEPPTRVNGWSTVGEVDWSQALTEEQQTAWAAFGAEWANVKRAWLARGFRRPPTGSAEDEGSDSQRSVLWEVLDARPNDLPAWIAGAPAGANASQVIGHVLDRWHALQADVSATTEAEDSAWAAIKAEDHEQAAQRMAELEAQL